MNDHDPPKSKRPWFRFSLRSLLVFVAVLAVPLSWFGGRMRQASQQREAVNAIQTAAGFESIKYDWNYTKSIRLSLESQRMARAKLGRRMERA